ncbi:YbbR-like domain-containing protein [Fructilactobacillus frigidiflavus]|uniref:CdaR family protein n=1 Tax=Fructilactobacillus frigidiflavus TaxID=3242688 RepID=UPI003756A105
MKKFFESRTFCLIISLVISLSLFFMVHDYKLGQINSSAQNDNQQLTSNEKREVEVPLQLNVNSDKYFVIGYPNKVKVELSGPSALVTTTANTQNFKILADLSDLGPGKHTVKLQQSGLNSELKSEIKPKTITVNVQERETDAYPVEVAYQSKNIANGYKVSKVSKDISRVNVTGPKDEMKKIKQVVAKVKLTRDTNKNIKQTTVIDALDERGRTINVVISPSTTTVKLQVEKNN